MSHRIRRSTSGATALALAAAALVAPAAQARPIDAPATGPGSPATQAHSAAPGLNHGAGVSPAVPVTPAPPKSGDSGVDWNSLAAGAGIGGATVLLLAAGVSARGRRSGRVAI